MTHDTKFATLSKREQTISLSKSPIASIILAIKQGINFCNSSTGLIVAFCAAAPAKWAVEVLPVAIRVG